MTISFRILNNPFLRRSLYSLILSLAIVCQGLSSHAVDILDNTSSATALSGSTITISSTGWEAIMFTSLTNVTARSLTILTVWSAGTPTTATYTVSLYAVDGSNIPTGSALATSTATGVTVVPNSGATKADAFEMNLTTNSTGSWSMLSNTNYALVLSTDLSYSLRVMSENPSTPNGTFIARRYSGSSGASWGPPQTSVPFFKLSTDLTPVPEPSTYLLCGLATGVVAVVSKKRKLKKA